ncbi:MAG: protein kinase [Planctomycetes bacterium]|nr:protein kinase [Planctomycetota bacterium]
MPLHIEPHAEPIPGYRLIERLGSGGFGEVWKAEAPGGLFKAIKFVQRHAGSTSDSIIDNTATDASRADQEWKSLIRVKSVRHPFILLLDRFENIENYLVIVMELADRTLADRFKECRSQGLPGIPREELLSYLAEAAEVLDLMNSQYQLQHLDIKPQNLFLVHQHIKVADFGLVKDTTDGKELMTITGGVTPVYAAPETFDGQFSRQSDQYSLAIVYQEMLTGHRPFTGTTMKQLILQHLQNAHDLTPAPIHDRPILARGLAKNPEDRFPTCLDFVQALKQTTARSGAVVSVDPSPEVMPSVNKTLGARGIAGPVKPVDPNFSVGTSFLRQDVGADPSVPSLARGLTPSASEPTGRTSPTPAMALRRRERERGKSAHEITGIVQPTLVIGIGRLGVETLTQLRQMFAADFGALTAIPKVRLLAIDTDSGTIQRATHGEARNSLQATEAFSVRLQRPSHYLKTRDGKLPTDSWLNAKLLHRIPREQENAGLRALGRLAFVDNYKAISRRLDVELHALTAEISPDDSNPFINLGVRTSRPRIYIATSLTGSTGGGMFLDIAYLLRRLLQNQGQAEAEIVGLFYLPTAKRQPGGAGPLANAFAALVELDHYSQPEAVFSAHYETAASMAKGERVSETGPAFQRCLLLPLPESTGKPEDMDNADIIARAGSFLYWDIATPLGQAFDEQRQANLRHGAPSTGPLLHSVGMYRIHWPRNALLDQASRRLCEQLVTRWLNKDASGIVATIHQWTQERWESIGMRPENLIERFHHLSEIALGKNPEIMLAEILAPIQTALASDTAKTQKKGLSGLPLGSAVQAMERLDRAIGVPDDSRSSKSLNFEPSALERALAEIAHGMTDECEQRLAELAVQLLEDPNFRLAGAEEALRQFSATVEQSLQSQETLARELTDKATQLYQRLHEVIEFPPKAGTPGSTQWTFRIGARPTSAGGGPSAADTFELLRTYAKTRYHSLILTNLNGVYLSLRGHLSDQIREVGFCRQRLGELQGLLKPTQSTSVVDSAHGRAIFPPGCLDLPDAVDQLVRSVTAADVVAFDTQVQAWIRTNYKALLEICMGSSAMVRNLAPALLHEAEQFLGARLVGSSVADMYLTRKRAEFGEAADERIRDDLERCLDEATPEIGKLARNNEISIASFPDDESGRYLQKLLNDRLPEVKTVFSARHDEMIFYHDLIRIQKKDLAQLGPIAKEAYDQRCAADPSSLHSREDVFNCQVIASTNR